MFRLMIVIDLETLTDWNFVLNNFIEAHIIP